MTKAKKTGTTLVIVESPTKAKTITKFLGDGFVIKSSFGHVRDLPKNEMGVDIEHNFEPRYVVSRLKSKVAKELKDAAKKCNKILFATDSDREGEAISWHLANILGVEPTDAERIVFHEITKTAIEEALKHPQPLNMPLVNAQQARRILDRLVGYELSPFLWRKVTKGLSAGRVQSVAVRLIVEREREILAFKSEEYWSIEAIFSNDKKEAFNAKLLSLPDEKLEKMSITGEKRAQEIVTDLKGATYQVASVETKKSKRAPAPPFTTSTLQQDANGRLGFSAKQTMRLAQQLYEGVELGSEGSVGLITYMRTDSVNLAEKFLTEAHALIGADYGAKYQMEKPRFYTNRSKNAQEAHEAIRPTDVARTPEIVKNFLDNNQYRLYDLIWRRAVATQMQNAILSNLAVDVVSNNKYTFHATGTTIDFDGFLKLYPERTKENILPRLEEKEVVNLDELKPEQHFTEPPARYSDATLVKVLELHGIGRPSTFAPTIATIEDRGYVERDPNKKLAPKEIAFLVNDLLVKHFPNIVDLEFTAKMENEFDEVAHGKKEWQPLIADFYGPFKANLTIKDEELKKSDIGAVPTGEPCPECAKPLVRRMGRFGAFTACSGYPDCKYILKVKVPEIKIDIHCPKCADGEMLERRSRFGKIFYSCNKYPDCKFALWNKPNGDKCPSCQGLLSVTPAGKIKCENKECPTYVARAPRKGGWGKKKKASDAE
ncbi:MAG: DNA topoisomerase I [Candidatus Magasanikbacteria bacterium RIFOXYC2_FULL_42_28]|uniref:DNA topoisomerase 1 n=1 Tax=Candidatus Magasanikbacteria bacterium RIFOXYC2_FULL_42_28 TaxID=1798704 RepID=A0A1F6NUX7_9BACT|nr:MAG: DNA topoisomerase I [Candidatus Magasanikbacteria bacterium RIFOXYC2_FULL_42_28]